MLKEFIRKQCQKPSTLFCSGWNSGGLHSLGGSAQQGKNRVNGQILLLRFHFPPPSLRFTGLPSPPFCPRTWGSDMGPDICQVSLGCFKALQNCTLSLPRNTTVVNLGGLCAQDHRSSSLFPLLHSGCQFAVKNKMIANPPRCK